MVGDCSSCRVKGAAIQADARAQSPISLTAYLTGFDEFGGGALRHCRKGPQRVGRAFGFDASKPSVSTQATIKATVAMTDTGTPAMAA